MGLMLILHVLINAYQADVIKMSNQAQEDTNNSYRATIHCNHKSYYKYKYTYIYIVYIYICISLLVSFSLYISYLLYFPCAKCGPANRHWDIAAGTSAVRDWNRFLTKKMKNDSHFQCQGVSFYELSFLCLCVCYLYTNSWLCWSNQSCVCMYVCVYIYMSHCSFARQWIN